MINLKKIIKITTFLTIILGTFAILSPAVHAAELNFAVETVIPENQIDPKKSYFELKMQPKQEQDLEIILRNDTQNAVVIEPSINSAFTNANGVVEYGKNEAEADETLAFSLADLITVPKEVTIPANSSTTIVLKVKMPKEAFKGILAGGITLKEKVDEEENTVAKDKEAGLAIQNDYAYVVGIVLNESDEAVKRELTLNDVFADQSNARNVIKANLQNTTPTFINQLKVTTKITEKGKDKVLYETTKEGMQMAPNTNFNFPTSLEGQKLKAGKYTLEMDAAAGEDSWHFTKDFEIKSDEAKAFNNQDVTIKKDNNWLYILAGVLGGMLLMIGIYLIVKKKKEKNNNN